MIDFKGKQRIDDCMERILAAGVSVAYVDNVLTCSDPVLAQAIIDGYTIDEAKRWKCKKVAEKARDLRDRAISSYSPGEMASWPIKLAEAAAYAVSRNEADAPMLLAECRIRGITLDAMLNKVNANASEFSRLEAMISGIDGKHRDAINALGSFEAIAEYDFSPGWPEV